MKTPNDHTCAGDAVSVPASASRDIVAGIDWVAKGDRASPGAERVGEMRYRWGRGERPLAEEFLNAEVLERPEAALDIIYEEYCLRQATGEHDVDHDILRRFPQWREPLRVMLDCHRVLQASDESAVFPCVGETVGAFRLIAEIGHGARGRVYVAAQTDLAGRPVVLKITALDGGEHLSLARLQHTNIVPVYSVEDDSERNIRILCMPYFGRATLASLIKSLAGVPPASRTGQHVVAAIDQPLEQCREPAPVAAPARQMLARVSYVQAVCWITACLADALEYAHEHGLVHLDVKPSNVLLAADGQPMLLDFHLAREPIRCDGLLPDKFGGTPAYMAPEQNAVMQALEHGVAVEQVVDARADIYALGAMLYELLAGSLPVAAEPLSLSRLNPHVSVGLADIVTKCLASGPGDRYASAMALADDLRRHLTDQRLTGAPNRSLGERWRKWRRRKTNTVRTAGLLGVVITVLTLAGAGYRIIERCREAEQALRAATTQLESGQYITEAVETLERGLSLIDNVPFQGELAGQLREQLATARQLRAAAQLHQLADRIRELYGTEPGSLARLRPLAEHAQALWAKRRQVAISLDASRNYEVATDLLDVAIFWADLQIRFAPEDQSTTATQNALDTLDEAARMFGPSRVLDYQRQLYRKVVQASDLDDDSIVSPVRPGLAQDSADSLHATIFDAATHNAQLGRAAWEHFALGRTLLNSNDLARAAEELELALALDPSGPWPNFYYGLCAHRLGRHEDAVAAFSVCIGAAPTLAGCYYNRAVVSTTLGRSDRGLQDYDRALQLDPKLAVAWLNRGMLYYQLQRYPEAASDLRQAMQNGADPAVVHYNTALIHLATRNTAAALEQLEQALACDPRQQLARQLRETLRTKGH